MKMQLLSSCSVTLLGLMLLLLLADFSVAHTPGQRPISHRRQISDGCEFNGTVYTEGESIPSICIDMTCVNGSWVTNHKFNENCKMCNVRNDPHIKTFDNTLYDWHGSCNYSISQLEFEYDETFGIYSQFQDCKNYASCLTITTFRDNLNSVIEIKDSAGPDVKVNDNAYTLMSAPEHIVAGDWHPVIAWRPSSWTPDYLQRENCNFFLGTQGYLLATCGVQLFVWASPILMDRVNGLCGQFDGNCGNDFINRNGVSHSAAPFPNAFPLSWQTADQQREGCPGPVDDVPEETEDPCRAGPFVKYMYYQTCNQLFLDVEKQHTTSSRDIRDIGAWGCIIDLCLMDQNGVPQNIIEGWKCVMKNMHVVSIFVDNNTE